MCSYLRSNKNDVWSLTKDSWTFPMHISKTIVIESKPINVWSKEELHLCNSNCQGLHLLINSVTSKDSYIMNNFINVKGTWEFLEKNYGI